MTNSASDCLFCKIRDGHIPAQITYRDEHLLAFKDIGPKAPLHQLVVPLQHVARLADAQPDDLELYGRLMVRAALIAREAGYGDSGFRVVMNSGADAGQTVFHVHLHVLGGRPFAWPPG
jgi:histidine triad (HIT) family protein